VTDPVAPTDLQNVGLKVPRVPTAGGCDTAMLDSTQGFARPGFALVSEDVHAVMGQRDRTAPGADLSRRRPAAR
jgi:hypothetical protein